jgi:hypothetical protein
MTNPPFLSGETGIHEPSYSHFGIFHKISPTFPANRLWIIQDIHDTGNTGGMKFPEFVPNRYPASNCLQYKDLQDPLPGNGFPGGRPTLRLALDRYNSRAQKVCPFREYN